MPDDLDRVFDNILRDMTHAMGEKAAETVHNLQQKLSVPVEYGVVNGKRVVTVRSKPGEHPRRETGRLRSEITSEVIGIGETVIAAITSPTPYAKPLQEEMDRPITDGELEATEESWIEVVAKAIDG